MLDLPAIDYLRTQISYAQIFLLTWLFTLGVAGIIIFGTFLFFCIIKMCIKPKKTSKQYIQTHQVSTGVYLGNQSGRQNDNNMSSSFENSSGCYKFVSFFSCLSFYLIFVVLSIIFIGVHGFGYIGPTVGHDVAAIVITFFILFIPLIIWKCSFQDEVWPSFCCQIVITIILVLLFLGGCIFGILAMKGICLCNYNQNYGIVVSTSQGISLSTEFSRSLMISQVCGDGELCHLYATVPEDTSTSVFINAHTGLNVTNLTINMGLLGIPIFTKISDAPFSLTNVDDRGKRNVHSVLFTGLTPATLYSLQVKQSTTGKVLKTINYRTLPNSLATSVKIVAGGDVGMTANGSTLTNNLASFDPDILIVGGDLAYDNGMRTCYFSWDTFYWMFEDLNNRLNRTVPMILTIGNHDVGYDALAAQNVSFNEGDIPFYFLYNPQHLDPNTSGMPAYFNRNSLHYHLIGHTVHLILDSGYVKTFESQTTFITNISTNFPTFLKFANYHNPVYPPCFDNRNFGNQPLTINMSKQHWTPLFDAQNFVAAFQHHAHYRKFTFKIRNGSLNSTNGMRYVGDGNWGVTEITCGSGNITTTPQLFESTALTGGTHVWLVTITNAPSINYTAVGIDGSSLFQKSQNI